MNRYRNYGITLLAGALLLAGFTGTAQALTNACVEISNRASLVYTVGGITQPAVLSTDGEPDADETTDFFVATRVDLTVSNPGSVSATGADNVMTFSITNTGNDTQRYMLQLYAGATGYNGDDSIDMLSVRVYTDTDNNYANGGTTEISASAATDGTDLGLTGDVAGNNGVIYVHVVANVPGGAVNGDKAYYALKARTYQTAGNPGAGGVNGAESDATSNSQNSCGEAVVLYDGDVDGGGSGPGGVTDASNNGDSYGTSFYQVATAAITVAKSAVVIWDPINLAVSPKAIPGARVDYTITVNNGSATVPATALVLSDQIPANTDFYVGSVSAPGGATISYSDNATPTYGYTPSAGANGADPAVTYVKVDIANLAVSSSAIVKFTVVVE